MKYILTCQGHTGCHRPLHTERRPIVTCQSNRQPSPNVNNRHEVTRRSLLATISVLPSLSLWASAKAQEASIASPVESLASPAGTEVCLYSQSYTQVPIVTCFNSVMIELKRLSTFCKVSPITDALLPCRSGIWHAEGRHLSV